MEKRLILAISISLLILVGWSAFVKKAYHIENKEVTSIQSLIVPIKQPAVAEDKIETGPVLKYEQPKLSVDFIESLAAIKEVTFKSYGEHKFVLHRGLLWQDQAVAFQKVSSAANEVVFSHVDQSKKITKRFFFSNSGYSIDLEIKIQNLSALPLTINPSLILAGMDYSSSNIQARYQDATVVTRDKVNHINAQKDQAFSNVNFLSLRDRYFCAIAEPAVSKYSGTVKTTNKHYSEVSLNSPELTLVPAQQIEEKFRIYLGPQDLGIINSIKPEWNAVVYYGTFDFISQILLQILDFLYKIVRNWGWAIVILSLLVYLVLYPLTLKQMRSMKEMQAIQPSVDELRNTCKDNPQRLNKEIMELYRKHKINPLAGCLPLILQMPIFFALYQALMRSIVLKGADFLWVKDLSEPDRLVTLSKSLPILGNEINILPIIMAIEMFFQQKMSAVSPGSVSSEQQKIMLIVFPIMFGFIFYHMASGLVLYWFINSALMLLYQLRVKKSTAVCVHNN